MASKAHRATSHLRMVVQHKEIRVTNHHRTHILRVVPLTHHTVVTKVVVPVAISLVGIHLLLLRHLEVEDTNSSPSQVTTKLHPQITNSLHRLAIQEVEEEEEGDIKVVGVVVVVDTALSQDTLVEVAAAVDIEEGMYYVFYSL